ncbi:MAG: tetratricopeptide repeat protein [Planctomycetaceae bacterium]|nr:tetratricopeptide repeat protein [Planctomycetaceae bacterium]
MLGIKSVLKTSGIFSAFAALLLAPAVYAQGVSAQPVSLTQEQSQALEKAQAAYDSRQYDQAIEMANSVLSTNPKQDQALFLRASGRVELGIQTANAAMIRDGVADARSAIEASQSKHPNYFLPYLYGMTNLSLIEERPEHAETSIGVATQILEKLEMSPAHRASILYQRGLAELQVDEEITRAVTDFKAAINLEPKHMPALTALADAYAMSGMEQEAIGAFNQMVTAFPEHPIAYNNRGMFYKELDKKDLALADFQKAIQLEPKFFVAHINTGYIQMELGQAANAQRSFTNALALQPENPSVYALRANALLRQGNSDGAIADYNKAIELSPNNPMAHADLGFAYFFLKNYDAAFKQFDAAININGRLRFLDPWIYGSMVLSGRAQDGNNRFAGTVAKPETERDWIDMVTLYLMGKIDEQMLLSKVNPEDDEVANAQRCEGHFFVGLRKSNLTGRADAVPHFEACLKTGAKHLSAYRAAQFEMQQF